MGVPYYQLTEERIIYAWFMDSSRLHAGSNPKENCYSPIAPLWGDPKDRSREKSIGVQNFKQCD